MVADGASELGSVSMADTPSIAIAYSIPITGAISDAILTTDDAALRMAITAPERRAHCSSEL